MSTCRLKRVLHILSPAEDAGEQRRSLPVVLLEWMPPHPEERRADVRVGGWVDGTFDSLPGAFDGFTEPNTPNALVGG